MHIVEKHLPNGDVVFAPVKDALDLFEIKFEPRDLWIGVYWDKKLDGIHVYVCPVPCVVFHWLFGYFKGKTR